MITALAITTCLLVMVTNFYVALCQMKATYILLMANGAAHVLLNMTLALADPDQWCVAILIFPNTLMALSGWYGLRRLRKELAVTASADSSSN